jgi:hypothetical protein
MTAMLQPRFAERVHARRKAARRWYYERDAETLPRERLEWLQLRRLRATLKNACENVPLHQRRMAQVGVRPRLEEEIVREARGLERRRRDRCTLERLREEAARDTPGEGERQRELGALRIDASLRVRVEQVRQEGLCFRRHGSARHRMPRNVPGGSEPHARRFAPNRSCAPRAATFP